MDSKHLLALFAAALVACDGGTAPVGSTTTSTGTGGPSTPPTPAIAFLDMSTGTPVPTTKMLWANPLDIRVTGLPPSTAATVTARFTGWGATATFTSDASGTIDLATTPSEAGSYTGIDADGIVWSMTRSTSPDDPPNDPFGLRVSVEVGGSNVASAELARLAKAEDVTCADVSEAGLVGVFCSKVGAPARGAIVTFGGSEGGLDSGRSQAAYYASLGYPSLGLAYFGAPGVPATLSSVPLEYFQSAFGWVEKQPAVSPGKIAVIGGSRGGELALLLGATFPEVTAVVAQLPSGLVWPGITSTGQYGPAWTSAGQPLPFIPGTGNATKVTEPDGVVAYSDRGAFVASIAAATPAQIDAATIRVEKTRGPILMLAGNADELWPACDLAQYATTRLASSGHDVQHGDALVCYPDAGHNVTAFTVGVPTTSAMHSSVKIEGQYLALGGTPSGIAHAARDADNRVRAFLAANLE